MNWWQILLVLIASIGGGLVVGFLISWLILRFQHKSFFESSIFSRRNPLVSNIAQPATTTPTSSTTPSLETGNPVKENAPEQLKIHDDKPKAGFIPEDVRSTAKGSQAGEAVVPTEAKPYAGLSLIAELEYNLKIAKGPWKGELVPFQTQAWDTNQSFDTLSLSTKDAIAQVYADIRLANSIVWLGLDLGRRSENLDTSYTKLCTSISARIAPILRSLGR